MTAITWFQSLPLWAQMLAIGALLALSLATMAIVGILALAAIDLEEPRKE